MAIKKINASDLKNKITSNKSKPSYYKKLEKINSKSDIEKILISKLDCIIESQKNDTLIFKINDIEILNLNEMFRIDFRRLDSYKINHKNRIISLISKNFPNLTKENPFFERNNELVLEILYYKNSKLLDYDGSVSCFKFLIDGLTKSHVIFDDNYNNIKLVLVKQIKSENNQNDLYFVLKKIDNVDSYFSDESKKIIEKNFF